MRVAALPGAVLGAVYKPFALIKPLVEFPPLAASTCHVTELFEVPVTFAVNCNVSPVPIEATAGGTVTRIPESIVTVADADLVVSCTEVAVTVTVFGLGTVAGAV